MFDHVSRLLSRLHWLKAPEPISYKVAVLVYQCQHGLNYDDQQSLKTFRLVNVLSRPSDTLGCLASVTERFLLCPLVRGTVFHRMSSLLHLSPHFTLVFVRYARNRKSEETSNLKKT